MYGLSIINLLLFKKNSMKKSKQYLSYKQKERGGLLMSDEQPKRRLILFHLKVEKHLVFDANFQDSELPKFYLLR